MSIENGSVSITRYKVNSLSRKKRFSIAELNTEFPKFIAKPLSTKFGKFEQRFGWVLPPTLTDEEGALLDHGEWDMSHCRIKQGFLLRFRIDSKKLAGNLVQAIYKRKVLTYERQYKSKPNAKKKREIKEEIREQLLEMALPTISFYDALWKIDDQELVLFSTGVRVREVFEKLFHNCFGKTLELELNLVDPPYKAEVIESERYNEEAFLETMSHIVPLSP